MVPMVPGQVILGDEPVPLNEEPPSNDNSANDKPTRPGEWKRWVWVKNCGNRAIQVGSHFHFYEANRGYTDTSASAGSAGRESKGLVVLDGEDGNPVPDSDDKEKTAGYRLDIPAGTAVRFEPGCTYKVRLVALAGEGTVPGLSARGTLKKWDWSPAPEGGDPGTATTDQSDPANQYAAAGLDTGGETRDE